MEFVRGPGVLLLWALLLPFAQPTDPVPSCQEVRSSFQFLHPGGKWVPENPVAGTDLQVCQPKGPSCCSRKMEERYQVVARQNMETSLQASSAKLKLLIIQNAALFQEAFEMVLRHGRNSTLSMLWKEFPGLGGGANGTVGRLFLEISLYILGSDSNVDDIVAAFFSRLFPLVYRRLLGGGALSDECLRQSWRDAEAFGSHPKMMMTRLSRSLLATRTFLQALNLGIEVVNTTDHLRAGRECGRALLHLWFCPHCLGLLGAPPCPGLCPTTMQGCLGGLGEVQPHWQGYVEGLGSLTGAMSGEWDVEAVVLHLHTLIRLAVRHAIAARSRLHAMVNSICPHSAKRVSRSAAASPGRRALIAELRRPQLVPFDLDETLAGRRRDFISSLKGFSNFYSGLAGALCSRVSAVLNGSLCWNGQEVTDRFLAPGPKRAQHHGPESKHKPAEPAVSQIIDKLKHINQLLRLVTAPVRRWRGRPAEDAVVHGRDEEEEGFESGDCDDEDECGGISGMGPAIPHHRRLRIFEDQPDDMDDFTFHEHLLIPRLATEGRTSFPGSVEGLTGLVGALPRAMLLLTLLVILFGLH